MHSRVPMENTCTDCEENVLRDDNTESDSGHPSARREDCQVCGGQESERWHFDSILHGLICDDCHRGVVRD